MPLGKRGIAPVAERPAPSGTVTTGDTPPANALMQASAPAKNTAPMSKDDYWRRREERDVQRDKDMAWSGLAQAAMQSVGLIQLNTSNTLEGFVELVARATALLLQERDKANSK